MTVSLPPRPPELGDPPTVDQEALIEEAHRRARRRRHRNLTGLLAAVLGALWLYSLLAGGGPQTGSAFLSESSTRDATPPRAALPEELSYNANGGVVLVRRDGTRRVLAKATYRHLPDGTWRMRMYSGIEWSRDGSKLLAVRWGSPRTLVAIDANGTVGPKIAQALDGRWSPDETRIAFVRHERGLGRVLFLAPGDGSGSMRIATHVGSFSWSPDATRLAYTRTGASGLFIASTGGRVTAHHVQIVTVGAPSAFDGDVQWAPDGSAIAIATGGGVFVVHADGTSLDRVPSSGYQIAWSPDSRLLALGKGLDVDVVRAEGGGLRRIAHCTCGFRGASGTSLAWSPDGSRIAYISGQGNDVSTIRPDGSGATVVVRRATPGPSGLAVGGLLWRQAP